MYWYDEYKVEINSAKELMLCKLDENTCFVLDPETIRNMITFVLAGDRPAMTVEKTTYGYKSNKENTVVIEMRIEE